MSAKLVINTFRENAKTKSEKLGNLELKYISIGDIEFFEKSLGGIKDDKEFVSRMIHHQLISPEITYAKFKIISEDDLRKIARDFIKYEKHTFKYFKETSDDEFFLNFRSAFKKHLEEENKKIRESFAQIIGVVDGFTKRYADVIKESLSPNSFLSEVLRESSQFPQRMKDAQFFLTESLKPMFQQYQQTATMIQNVLKPQINVWQNWAEQNRKIFENINIYWKSFRDEYKISEQQAITILKKYKWFVTPSMPIAFVFEVVRIGRRRGNHRGEINRLFVDYFRSDDYRELKNLVDRWTSNAIFKPRMKIFRDCVVGLKNAKKGCNPSNFVLPALIAQIDGIQKEYMEKNGLSFDLRKGKWMDSDGKEVGWKKWYKSLTENQNLNDLVNNIFLNILFQKSYRGEPLKIPSTFNRHKILHGENIRYGRMENTIKAFLVLDFLASLK